LRRIGFSLAELLLTVALLVLLTGWLSLQYGPIKEQRRQTVAREELRRIRDAVEASRVVTAGRDALPEALQSVPGLAGAELVDPWGQSYSVVATRPCILSPGPDGVQGTEDDLSAPLSPVRTGLGWSGRR
jgi:hypothetical protein